MSGFAGALSDDGADARALLDSVRARGGDGEGTWSASGAAFAHALLTFDGPQPAQPLERDGLVIVSDARIDAREELVAALRNRGADVRIADADAVLLLAAYRVWGDACVKEIEGEFSFAIYDIARERLFCARDRVGMRPFCYAAERGVFRFANELSALTSRDAAINEDAVADFLLFGQNLDPSTTFFEGIRRLRPGHTLVVERGGVTESRYWQLPILERPIRIREADAVEQFRALFLRAVKHRARADRLVIAMSGGLDSTSVAAAFAELRREGEVTADARALTSVFRSFDDPELRYSRLAADALGIPIDYQFCDDFHPYDDWQSARTTEPVDQPRHAAGLDYARRVLSHGRVLLMGHGGDSVLYSSHEYFFDLLRRMRWIRFVRDAGSYALTRRRLPPLVLREKFKRAIGKSRPPEFPSWISPRFAVSHSMRERWNAFWAPERIHPFRNDAYMDVTGAFWPTMFEALQAATGGRAFYATTPFFDAKLLEFLFRLPPMPHFADKDLLRRAMKGLLPDELRLRRKTPFRGPDRGGDAMPERRLKILSLTAELDAFVDRRIICEEIRGGNGPVRQQGFAVALGTWLAASASVPGHTAVVTTTEANRV